MNVLLSFFILFGLGISVDYFRLDKTTKLLGLTLLTLLIIIVGSFRWRTGNDWFPYYNFFTNNVSYRDFMSDPKVAFEYGYRLLNTILRPLNSYTFFLFVITSFTVISKISVIFALNQKYAYTSIFLYYVYYLSDLVTTRQSIAMSLCFIATIMIVNKSKLAFIYTIIFATFFHFSSVVMFPAYYLFHKLKPKMLLYIILFIIPLTPFFKYLLLYYLDLIYSVNPSLEILLRIKTYIDMRSLSEIGVFNADRSFLLGSAKKLILLPFFIYLAYKDEKSLGFVNLWLYGILIYMIFTPISFIFQRLSVFLLAYEIILIPRLKNYFPRDLRPIFILLVILYGWLKFSSYTNQLFSAFNPFLFLGTDS